MDSVLSNEVARRIAADLATLVSEAEKHGTLPRIKSVAFYFNETELRTIIKLMRSRHGILDPAQTAPRTPAEGASPDLTRRLREPVMLRYNAEQINAERREAAAEIERLTAQVEDAKAGLQIFLSVLRGGSSYVRDCYELHVNKEQYSKAVGIYNSLGQKHTSTERNDV